MWIKLVCDCTNSAWARDLFPSYYGLLSLWTKVYICETINLNLLCVFPPQEMSTSEAVTESICIIMDSYKCDMLSQYTEQHTPSDKLIPAHCSWWNSCYSNMDSGLLTSSSFSFLLETTSMSLYVVPEVGQEVTMCHEGHDNVRSWSPIKTNTDQCENIQVVKLAHSGALFQHILHCSTIIKPWDNGLFKGQLCSEISLVPFSVLIAVTAPWFFMM